MRSKLSMAARLCCVFLLLQLLSCTKFDLKDILHHPENVPQLCDIKKITSYEGSVEYPDTTTATFYYNKSGNPERVLFNRPATGRPHLYFRYNKQGKLTDYYGPYREDPSAGFEFWYRYVYDAQGKKIIGDSLFGLGEIVNNEPHPPPSFVTAATYEYDQYDRVIKIQRHWVNIPGIPLQTTEYAYDSKGNRIGGVFGDKPNLHRTNKVWMIVDYDYSVNNSIEAVSYNKYGLPLRTDQPPGARFLYNALFGKTVFTYSCK